MAPLPLIRYLLLSLPLFLPFAQAKFVLFGFPLYLIELPVLLAALLFLRGIRSRKIEWKRFSSFETYVFFAASLFFLGAILSFLHNPFSLTGLGMLKTWFFFPLLFVFFMTQMEWGEENREKLFLLWLGSTGVIGIGALVFLLTGQLTYDGRLTGWYASPNYLAVALAPGALIALYFLLIRKRDDPLAWRDLSLGALLILFLVLLFFTHSYGAWGALFLSSLALIFSMFHSHFSQEKKQWILPSLLAVLGMLTFFSIELNSGSEKWRGLLSFEERSSLRSRVMIWESAGKMIADEPFFGIGPGRFQAAYLEYQKYFSPYLEWAVPEPHNLYLAVWLSTGLFGLAGFLLLVYFVLRHLWEHLRKQKEITSALLPLALLLFYLLYGLLDTPYFKTDLAFSFWLLIALILSYKLKELPTGAQKEKAHL